MGCQGWKRLDFYINKKPPQGGTESTGCQGWKHLDFYINKKQPQGGTESTGCQGWKHLDFYINKKPPQRGTESTRCQGWKHLDFYINKTASGGHRTRPFDKHFQDWVELPLVANHCQAFGCLLGRAIFIF